MIISAREAHEKTNGIVNQDLTQELEFIEEKINSSILDGLYSVSYDGSISQNARAKLEELGYRVKTGPQYNESYVVILWN